jgi:hypothetical protein
LADWYWFEDLFAAKIINKDKTITKMPEIFRMFLIIFWEIIEINAPKPNIKTPVPKANKNKLKDPLKALPEVKAYNCMACKGPQGIKPLSNPIIKGADFLFFCEKMYLAINCGVLSFNFSKIGHLLTKDKPRKNIKIAAKIVITPLKLGLMPKKAPNPPRIAPITV